MPGEVQVLAQGDRPPERALAPQGHGGMRVREGDRVRVAQAEAQDRAQVREDRAARVLRAGGHRLRGAEPD